AETLLGAKGVFQAGEVRVGVDQDRIQVAVRQRTGALVVTHLIAVSGRQDVAQAREEERAVRPGGARRVEQRQELRGELLSPEGEELEDDSPRLHAVKGTEDRLPPLALRVLERPPGVAADEPFHGVEAERRKIDELDPRRPRQP